MKMIRFCQILASLNLVLAVPVLGQRNWNAESQDDPGVEARIRIIVASENYYRSHHLGADSYRSAASRMEEDPDALRNWARMASTIDTSFSFVSIDTLPVQGRSYIIYQAPAAIAHDPYVLVAPVNGYKVYKLLGFLDEGKSLDSAEILRFTQDAFNGHVTNDAALDLVRFFRILYYQTIVDSGDSRNCVVECSDDSLVGCVQIDTVLTPEPLIGFNEDVVADAEYRLSYFVRTSGRRIYLFSCLLGDEGILEESWMFWRVCEL